MGERRGCCPCICGGNGAERTGDAGMDALEGEGPQRRFQKRLGRRLEEVAKAVKDGYCRLQTPLRLALGVRGTVAGHGVGALYEGGGGCTSPPSQCIPRRGAEEGRGGGGTTSASPQRTRGCPTRSPCRGPTPQSSAPAPRTSTGRPGPRRPRQRAAPHCAQEGHRGGGA